MCASTALAVTFPGEAMALSGCGVSVCAMAGIDGGRVTFGDVSRSTWDRLVDGQRFAGD